MVSKAKELVKGIVKNAAPKSTYATDPNDPWSAKAGIAENVTSRRADLLKKFYKAKGYNIDYVPKNQRVGQAKTGEFDKWKANHGIYEEDTIDEGVTYEPASGKPSKTSAGHTLVGHSWHSDGTKHANIMKHGETGKYFAAGGSSSHPTKTTTFHDSPEEAAKGKKSSVKEETAPIAVKKIRSHTSDSPTRKRAHQLNKAAQDGTIKTVHPPAETGLRREDNINDPQCATQSPFDGGTTPNDVAPKKSKAGKMVKEIYAKHRLREDLYDHEKDDKGPGTSRKDPKVIKKVEVNDDNEKGTNARMVLKGGTTLTGEKRDTIEIDPMLKNRSKTADYLDQDPKKQQLRTK